jgi:predicted transcriptional regulator
MTKLDILADTARTLSKEQLDALIDFAQSMGRSPFIDTAPREALAALDQGLAEIRDGRTNAGADVFNRIDRKLRLQRL